MPNQDGPHQCRCTCCYDFKLPTTVQRPGHVAFRLGNARAETHVFLNAVEVTSLCIEALPGDEGYAVLYSLNQNGQQHYCFHCSRRVCMNIEHGKVRVINGDEVYE